jgi:hypothetical protein
MSPAVERDHTAAIQEFGYTAREAEFIALAALHSGYFLRRQYSPRRGKLGDTLCKKIIACEHGTARAYGSGTHLYHIHSKPLYRALGQEDNRHRKNQDSFHLRGKVMGLDYVLLHPGVRFLPTEQDKLDYFAREIGLPLRLLPTKTYRGTDGSTTARFFVDKYPVAVRPTGGVQFCYIDDGVFTAPSFPTWLDQYAPLIRSLKGACITYIATNEAAFPGALKEFVKQFPETPGGLPLEMLEYFQLRQGIEKAGVAGRSQDVLDAYRKAARKFSEARHETLYRSWVVNRKMPAPVFKIAIETYLLPYSYRFFGSLNQRKP